MNDNDFKYMMQDLYRLYFGIRCTYREILENEDAYYKFKAVCRHYLITEVDEDTTLESHLYHLAPGDPCAEVYKAIGARVKLNIPDDVSVISFDDNTYLDYLNPPVTRIKQPVTDIAETAINLLIQAIAKKEQLQANICMAPSIVLRNSIKHLH